MDGSCTGAQYSDPYGTWDHVVVQASIKITLRNFEVPIRCSMNEIILPSGLHCKVAPGQCLDTDGGDTFWSAIPEDSCHFDHYDILYEGIANKLTPKINQTPDGLHGYSSRDYVRTLEDKRDQPLWVHIGANRAPQAVHLRDTPRPRLQSENEDLCEQLR